MIWTMDCYIHDILTGPPFGRCCMSSSLQPLSYCHLSWSSKVNPREEISPICQSPLTDLQLHTPCVLVVESTPEALNPLEYLSVDHQVEYSNTCSLIVPGRMSRTWVLTISHLLIYSPLTPSWSWLGIKAPDVHSQSHVEINATCTNNNSRCWGKIIKVWGSLPSDCLAYLPLSAVIIVPLYSTLYHGYYTSVYNIHDYLQEAEHETPDKSMRGGVEILEEGITSQKRWKYDIADPCYKVASFQIKYFFLSGDRLYWGLAFLLGDWICEKGRLWS